MLNRRNVLLTTAATCIATTTAYAAPSTDVKINTRNLTPSQKDLLGIRMPTLDAESEQDFVVGIKKLIGGRPARPSVNEQTEAFLKAKGLSMRDDTDLSYEECFNVLMGNPEFAAGMRIATTIQHLMWDRAMRVFHRRADEYMTMMESTDKKGPGSLELDPNMFIPDSCRYEIHAQPGGFVGDPLGGWVYHYAVTLGYRVGTAFHDENHLQYAQGHQVPGNGIVRRALDIGCGTGQSTTAIKMRFHETEVWGVDVGGPMVRYAHNRAARMNMDVNFRQALAEDTKFPDNYFDMVSDTILFHEVAGATLRPIADEIFRILRPGGTFSHHDTNTEGNPKIPLRKNIVAKSAAWTSHRYNCERWWLEFIQSDFPAILQQAGFKLDFETPIGGRSRVIATKPA